MVALSDCEKPEPYDLMYRSSDEDIKLADFRVPPTLDQALRNWLGGGMKGIKSARYGIISVSFICAYVGLSMGCQTHSQQVYSSQLNEIEAAKSRGELSGAEYLQLKHQAHNAHKQREAYNRAGLRAIFERLEESD